MPYTPNATDSAEPIAGRTVVSAAQEFRTLKDSINTRVGALEQLVAQGNVPGAVSEYTFTANGGVSYTLPVTPLNAASINVFRNGVVQAHSSFSLAGAVVTTNSAYTPGDTVIVQVAIPLQLGTTLAEYVQFTAAGTGAAVRTALAKLRERVSLLDFGADSTGVAASDTAFANALAYCIATYNKTLHVPGGIYKLTGRITVTQGVMIVCEGSQGSNEAYGTVFVHHSTGSCFRWDGSGAQYAGTGGGLTNCLIVKAAGFSGGNTIEVVNQSDTNRCGEMVFHNILGYGLSTGRWERGAVFDGTLTNTPGARGVRTVHMTKCRFADVTTANETVVLNQVTHFYAHGLACDTGSGAAAGITLKGINDGVYLDALGCAGTFTIVANDANNTTNNLTVGGKIGGAITVNDTQVNGVMQVANAGGGIAIKSELLRLIADNAPEFLATRITSAADVTGDGTVYQVAFDNEVFDSLGNFGTNVFTCTVAGKYQFTAGITYKDLGAAHTRSDFALVKTGSPTRSVTDVTNPYVQSISGGYVTRVISAIFNLEYGNTVYLTAGVTGGTKTVDVFGTAGTDYSWFAGKYLP